jgi:hypothetical protein
MGNYNRFLAMLSTESHKYLIDNEQLGEKIPPNAMVVFQVDGDDAFNRWHRDMSLRNREKDQPDDSHPCQELAGSFFHRGASFG